MIEEENTEEEKDYNFNESVKEDNIQDKIKWLQDEINYSCYKTLLDNNFSENQLLELYEELHSEDVNYDGTTNYRIVSKKEGKIDSGRYKFIEIWINQTCNGGYTGDSFSGDTYIKIKDNLYLAFGWWC